MIKPNEILILYVVTAAYLFTTADENQRLIPRDQQLFPASEKFSVHIPCKRKSYSLYLFCFSNLKFFQYYYCFSSRNRVTCIINCVRCLLCSREQVLVLFRHVRACPARGKTHSKKEGIFAFLSFMLFITFTSWKLFGGLL